MSRRGAWHHRSAVERTPENVSRAIDALKSGLALRRFPENGLASRETLARWSKDEPELARALAERRAKR